MKRIVFGKSVQGASHKRVDMECQDSFIKFELDDKSVILAIADGHGSNACPYSQSGSRIAVNIFVNIMKNFYYSFSENLDMLSTYLNREGDTKVAQTIDNEWKRHVLLVHDNKKREVPLDENGNKDDKVIYRQYGTTLVGILITPLFVFAYQMGDGDIMYITDNGIEEVLQADKILGTETHSLSKIDSWKKAITVMRRKNNEDDLPALYILATDGFSNSFKNENEFKKTCLEYYSMMKEYGPNAIKLNLKDWLSETSEEGCGDDITLLMCYFYNKSVKRKHKKKNKK